MEHYIEQNYDSLNIILSEYINSYIESDVFNKICKNTDIISRRKDAIYLLIHSFLLLKKIDE
jgi:hypothetical protein